MLMLSWPAGRVVHRTRMVLLPHIFCPLNKAWQSTAACERPELGLPTRYT